MIRRKFTASQILVLGFFFIILIGTILLNTPFASSEGNKIGFLDALFTSTSAVCVTGLVVVDTGTYWSIFGKFIIILLIQTGGLGFMSMAALGAFITGKDISIGERMLLGESSGYSRITGVVRYTKSIILITFLIEFIGAIFLSIVFIPEFGLIKGVLFSFFHSISAFCNAGFDLMGGYNSLISYNDNFIVNITIMLLIVLGGFGFYSLKNIYEKKFDFEKYSLHTKLVIIVTTILIIFPAILFFIIEYNNPDTIGNLPLSAKIYSSFFQIISPRTAGFNTLDLAKLRTSSKFLQIILMTIGGSPGSTAGGLKTVTLAVIILAVVNQIRGNENIEVFNRTIGYSILNKALVILSWCIFLIFSGVMIICLTDPNYDFLDVLYEVTSAYATVGSSFGITRELSPVAKCVIIFIMFSGRVGSLTFLYAFFARKNKKRYFYSKEDVNVG